jgi:hypothetical protein
MGLYLMSAAMVVGALLVHFLPRHASIEDAAATIPEGRAA